MTAPQESYQSATEQSPGTVEEVAKKPDFFKHSASGLVDNLLSDLALIRITASGDVYERERGHVADLILDAVENGSFNIVPEEKFDFRREYIDIFINMRLSLFNDEERLLAHEHILEYERLRKQGLATTPAPRTDIHPSQQVEITEPDYSESDLDVTTGEKFMRIVSRISQKTLEIIGVSSPANSLSGDTTTIKQLASK